MPIRQLAPDVAAKIAAGEVVERPASVVKELIENSIDAGATQIRVDLAQGGLQLIRVTDNGTGIPIDELPLALSRHATSKVAQIDDLEHISTLGFRGEALASLAAVAEVTLLSRYRGSEQGAQISAVNGQLVEITTAASPEGTTLTVRNLFSSVPARLKFLKSRNTEISHCHHLLEQYALAYPEIRFSVFSDGKQIFATPGNGQLTSVLVEVYGLQIADQMVPAGSQEASTQADSSDDLAYPVVTGYVSRPSCYKSTRQFISFFVNRRWVLSRMLTSAVEGAYHSLLLTGRHPIAVINIQIDPTLLDVNVHPAKTEIRFLKERRVFAAVLRAVRQALLEEPTMPQWKPRDTDVQRAAIDEIEPSDNEEIQTVGTDVSRPSPIIEDTELPLPQDNPWLTVTEEESGTKPPPPSRLWQNHVRTTENEHKKTGTSPITVQEIDSPSVGTDSSRPIGLSTTDEDVIHRSLQMLPTDEDAMNRSLSVPDENVVNRSVQQDTLLGQTYEQQARRLPHLRVVGQLSQSYIVTEGEDGMYLIDQHAAHERILLERMVVAMKARTPISQLLLTPLNLSLAPSELEAIEDHQQQLTQIGFSFEMTESNTLSIVAVPSILVKQMNMRSLHELLVELTAPDNLGHTETWEEQALANVACKAAIKANYFLTVSEMREMIEQLEQTKAPYSCCHGRPTMVHFGLSALAHEFERR